MKKANIKLKKNTSKETVETKSFLKFTCFFISHLGIYRDETAPKPRDVKGEKKSIIAIPRANIPNERVAFNKLWTKYSLKKNPNILINISPEKETKDCLIIFIILSTY